MPVEVEVVEEAGAVAWHQRLRNVGKLLLVMMVMLKVAVTTEVRILQQQQQQWQYDLKRDAQEMMLLLLQ
jgi:hypothetical protein